MPVTKADGFENALDEIQSAISTATIGDGDQVLNILESIVNAMSQLNMRLHRLEANNLTKA